MRKIASRTLLALCLLGQTPLLLAQSIPRQRPNDAAMECLAIATEQKSMSDLVAAGDPAAPSMGKAAAGTAANVGGQVAGAVVAQSSGLFGSLGGLVSRMAGAVAQQQVEQRMAPDAETRQRATEAGTRLAFLNSLASARECRKDDPSFAGKPLSEEAFRQLSTGVTIAAAKPLSAGDVQALPGEAMAPLEAAGLLQGDLKIAGKRAYISEYRLLFEVAGEVSANTRAGYMPGGTSYGATSSRTKYQVASPDISALQAITDRAWRDLNERLAAQGVILENPAVIAAQFGEVYPATEAASLPGAPVYAEENLGHTLRKYLVLAPSGMKIHPRGIAGLGAGNIGKRIDWAKNKVDAIAIGIAVNIAALETSGSGSSILNRDGASTSVSEGMALASPVGSLVAQGHVEAGALRLTKGFPLPGGQAQFKAVGGFDSQQDGTVRALQLLGNLQGVAANKSRTTEMEVSLDGAATARATLRGLATFNQALVERVKAGQ